MRGRKGIFELGTFFRVDVPMKARGVDERSSGTLGVRVSFDPATTPRFQGPLRRGRGLNPVPSPETYGSGAPITPGILTS